MAGGGGGGLVVRVWKEWGIEILVVTSFLLQLVLLVFGGFRRRSSSAVLLAFLWLSYLMADNIAVYAFGHMTLESRPQDTGLVAFWATFFLLHLGGQDTITAFSMEDNQLWRRHLLTLVVQASGAGYAIYRYIIPGTWTLVSATIVMFIVGFIKYGERVWALQRGGTDTFDIEKSPSEIYPVIRTDMVETEASKMDGEEVILLDAHSMFHFCKSSFFNISQKFRFAFAVQRNSLPYKCNIYLYDLIEAELSLLYDMFYTKAQLVHTWQGCFIRVISLIGTVSAFLLFHLDGKDAYNRVDISITYLLSVGAIILETTSVFRLLGSTWTCEYLNRHGWKRIISMVMCVRGLLKVRSQRRWLHSIGQHNMLEYCTRKQTKCTSITAQATVLKKWWRKMNFSGNIPITVKFKKLVLARIFRTFIRCKTLRIWDAQGKAVLTQYGILDDFRMYVEGNPFSDCVHNWHIATDIYFYCCNDPHHEDDKPLVEAIKVLSNYMGFLMIHHPSLLPGGVQQDIGTVILEETWQDSGCSTSKEFSKSLVEDNDEDNIVFCPYALLAGKLLENEKGVPMLQVIFGVWVEFLSYAAHHSTEVSHVKQLGRGGEFLTVIRLVLDHVELFQKHMVETLTTGCGDDSPINLAGLDATIVHSLESLRVDCEYGPTI